MAISAEIKNLHNEVKIYGKANWDTCALTSDGKVVNRCWCGFLIKLIPNAIMPSWLKRLITNADITQAYPKVAEKLKALISYNKTVNDPTIASDCKVAVGNLNMLMDKVNRTRKEAIKLPHFDLDGLKPPTTETPKRKRKVSYQEEKSNHQYNLRGKPVYPLQGQRTKK
jgi:hypothetical protein